MNLTQIKQAISEALPLLDEIVFEGVTLQGSPSFYIRNFDAFKQGMDIIFKFRIFDSLSDPIISDNIYRSHDDSFYISHDSASSFLSAISVAKDKLTYLNYILGMVLTPVEPHTIFIKIVEPNDLMSLEKNIEVFQKILSELIIHEDIGGSIIYEGVEPGSTWVKVNVGVQAAVGLIGSLAWASAVVFKKIQEGRIIEEVANSRQLDNLNKEHLVNANKVLLDFQIELEAMQIYHTYYKNGNVDNEQIGRIKHSIKMFSEEIGKGAEIIPSLTAPEEVSNLFPDMKKLPIIESRVKKIGPGDQ